MTDSPRRSTAAFWGLSVAGLGWMLFFITAFYALGDPPPGPGYEALIAKKVLWTRGFFVAGLACESVAFTMGIFAARRSPLRAVAILLISGAWFFVAGRALVGAWMV